MELTRENISLYCQIGTMLDGICEKYFDNVADGDWQFYSDWGVYDGQLHLPKGRCLSKGYYPLTWHVDKCSY